MNRINSRQKGKCGELDACKFLREIGFTARRGQQFRGGSDSPDVIVDELPDVHLEVKRNEAMALGNKIWTDACAQAKDEAGLASWAVLWRPNRAPWHLTFIAAAPFLTVTLNHAHGIKIALEWLQAREKAIARGLINRSSTPSTER